MTRLPTTFWDPVSSVRRRVAVDVSLNPEPVGAKSSIVCSAVQITVWSMHG